MKIYLDTSVVVSIYVPEKHSSFILKILQETQSRPYLSRLTETEFHAALAQKVRTKELKMLDIQAVTSMFDQHLAESVYEHIYLTDTVFTLAIEFLSSGKTPLRTLDALHLACNSIANATLVTADKVLAKSAEHFNIPVLLV